jgi:predicted transcriptional regulator
MVIMIILNPGAHIGEALQRLRTERGLSQAALGQRMHYARPAISKRERRPNLTLDVLLEHVTALGYTVALIPDDGDMRPRYSTEDFATEYALLRSEGFGRRQIADRLGMTRHAVDQAYLRATRKNLLTPDRRRRLA